MKDMLLEVIRPVIEEIAGPTVSGEGTFTCSWYQVITYTTYNLYA
jgi:hypothetical protein